MSVTRSPAIEVQVLSRTHSGIGSHPEHFVNINVDRSPWKSVPVEAPITIVEALSLAAALYKLEGI
jgi:hypothetical protein